MKVYGMGEKKTPPPFIVACDKFIYIEVIRAAGERAREEDAHAAEAARTAARKGKKKNGEKSATPDLEMQSAAESAAQTADGRAVPAEVVELLADSLESIADEDGYAFMGKLGNLLLKKQPDFDPRNYGFSKLTHLVKALDRFEIDVRQTSASDTTKHIYLRDRKRK